MEMTMKTKWEEPMILVQQFVPNEYVAACGDGGTTYNFECNAGSSNKSYAIKDSSGKVATISGMYINGGYSYNSGGGPGRRPQSQTGYYYHPCNETHKADSNSGFLTGYHLDDPKTPWDENISVIIWTDNGTDAHCTTNLNMEAWETAKS